jgi:hypothetical protein
LPDKVPGEKFCFECTATTRTDAGVLAEGCRLIRPQPFIDRGRDLFVELCAIHRSYS